MALDLKGKTVLSKNKYLPMLACMLALLFCVLATRPFVSMGVCDDWSYIWTARVLADTGHLTYNGWAAMPLGWQAYLGALFIKLFGFSFTITRSSVLVISLLCAALMQRIFVRTGASESMASIATLSLVLSPLFLPLSFSFMSDIPALFALLLCIYCCLRAFQSVSDKTALGWLAFAALLNLAGGTVRQSAWLGVLVMVPSAAWHMRRRRHMLPVGAALWAVSGLGIALYMHWFHAQPYSVIEKVFYKYHLYSAVYGIEAISGPLVCLLPIMSAFLVKNAVGKSLSRLIATITGACAASMLFWWAITTPINYFSVWRNIPFAMPGNYVTNKGVGVGPMLGDAPDVMPVDVRFLLTVAALSALSCFFVCLINERGTLFAVEDCAKRGRSSEGHVSNASLTVLLAPFAIVYFFLIVTRVWVYDRYFLPLQFVFTLFLIRVYRQVISEQLPRLCIFVGFVYVAYAVASTHDLFVFDRARVDATKQIIATGIPRTAIEAGFEYDAWTQLQQTGYVNEPRIVPSDVYHPWVAPNPNVPPLCIGWFRPRSPSVHPLLHLSHAPDNCYSPSQFAPFVYETWLPPRRRTIYILEGR